MRSDSGEGLAWLEGSQGERIPIRASCSFGRSPGNQIALESDKVSRRHALLQVQRDIEFWLIDLGSSNGTYLNGQRITNPKRLQDGDSIAIGPFTFIFKLTQRQRSSLAESTLPDQTLADIRSARCWLMVADIISSTRIFKELPPDQVPIVAGQWLGECKRVIEAHGGRINQFLGDGFFAYWLEQGEVHARVAAALESLRMLQAHVQPEFRFVVHYGEVVLGGVSLGEEERISGKEVHFVFRMEKLAAELGQARLLSQPAWERVAAIVEARAIGEYAVAGFESKVGMYAF